MAVDFKEALAKRKPPPPPVKAEGTTVVVLPPLEEKPKRGSLYPWMIPAAAALLEQGAPLQYAADMCGVEHKTFRTWLRKGAEDDAPPLFKSLLDAVRPAMHTGKLKAFVRLQRHAEVDPKTALALAKVLDPELWEETTKHQVTVEAKPQIDASKLSPEKRALYRQLRTEALLNGENDE